MRFPNPFVQKRKPFSPPWRAYRVWFTESECDNDEVNTTTIYIFNDNLSQQEAEKILIEQLNESGIDVSWLQVLQLWRVQ